MGFVERGINSFFHPGNEYKRQLNELNNLESDELNNRLNKTVILRYVCDGGKYIPLLGTMVLGGIGKIPPDVECTLLPVTFGVAITGLAAEAYYTVRNKALLDILYARGIRKPPSILLKEIKEEFQELFRK